MLGQDQDQDIPRLRSFSGPGAADDLSSKPAKKNSKRDPSPLSRMGSSLLRPFKGLSKLRTSRSSDKDGKLQGQSRAASHTDSLASRATSTSTQDAAGPSRFNSASLQNPNLQGGKSALEPSDSFRFRRTGTEDAPDLAAEPSFAQDLPQNSRSVQAGSTFRAQAPFLSSRNALLTANPGSVRPGQPPNLSSSELQQKVSGADAAADSDDEFDYDFSQPAASQRSTAAPPPAALLQPKVVSTSSLQAEVTTARADGTGGGLQAHGNTDSYKGEGGLTHTAGIASQQKPSGFSIEPGKFRPQRSRAEKPQLAVLAASVYSPLESGAATSPTMRGTGGGDSRDDAHETEDQAGLVLQEGQPPATGSQKIGNDQQVVLQHGSGDTAKGSQAQAPTVEDAQPQAGGLSKQGNGKEAQGSSGRQDGPAAQPSGSHRGILHGALAGQGFLDEGDDSSSPSVSIASSAASSEFDILEALPDKSSQLQPPSTASLPASPLQPQAEHHTVQRSAYSDTPILGPSTSKYGQPGSSASAASAGGQGSSATLSHRGLLHDGAQQAHLQASALPLSPPPGLLAAADPLPATPRRGFSDKPILAVYSRRPSADGEAAQAKDAGGQIPPSDPVLQTKVSTMLDCFQLSLRTALYGKHLCNRHEHCFPKAVVMPLMWFHVCQQCTDPLLCTKPMSPES